MEFAHRVPILRSHETPRGTDVTLRSVRADPFAFLLLCRACHRAYDLPADGTLWGRPAWYRP